MSRYPNTSSEEQVFDGLSGLVEVEGLRLIVLVLKSTSSLGVERRPVRQRGHPRWLPRWRPRLLALAWILLDSTPRKILDGGIGTEPCRNAIDVE